MTELIHLGDHRRRPKGAFFDRRELNRILNVYSRRVASGEWRDYAIDYRGGMVVFSIFRSTHEVPLFSVTKQMVGGRPEYSVFQGPRRLRKGSDLTEVLSVFDRKLRLISG